MMPRGRAMSFVITIRWFFVGVIGWGNGMMVLVMLRGATLGNDD
jgi:hypothetical protein